MSRSLGPIVDNPACWRVEKIEHKKHVDRRALSEKEAEQLLARWESKLREAMRGYAMDFWPGDRLQITLTLDMGPIE